MTESKLNSYTGRWASKRGFLTVDAPNLESAVMEMKRVKGVDPMTVVRLKDDVYIANEEIDYMHVQVLAKYNKLPGEEIIPDFGQVYPKKVLVPYKDQVILTAIANPGYTFLSYTNENGDVLTTGNEFKFVVKGNTTIYANFQKGGRTDIPYTFNENQFLVTNENYVSIKTAENIVDDPDLIPTSKAVYQGLEGKVDKGDPDYENPIEIITLNDRPVEVEDKVAKIDLTQEYLYEDEDINFDSIM